MCPEERIVCCRSLKAGHTIKNVPDNNFKHLLERKKAFHYETPN